MLYQNHLIKNYFYVRKALQHHSVWCNMLYALPLADDAEITIDMHIHEEVIKTEFYFSSCVVY